MSAGQRAWFLCARVRDLKIHANLRQEILQLERGPIVSRSTVVIAALFLLMSILEAHAQDPCGCRRILDPTDRAFCYRSCYSAGTFQVQSTGRSFAPPGGGPSAGSSAGPAGPVPLFRGPGASQAPKVPKSKSRR
jgi:hypothetical protein